MKSRISNKFLVVFAMAMCASLIVVASLAVCSQPKLTATGPYPNQLAESAVISDKYKEIANTLSESGIEEFLAITKIPRETGNMDGIRNYMMNWAKTNNVNATLDSSGCIYMDIPATAGHENDKNVILQAHMDMVIATAPDYTTFDKTKDGIDAVYDKEAGTIFSKDHKTSLGADDGEGLGLCLAIAKNDTKFEHGPFRLLFTYDEEQGLGGARLLDASILNADYLINFDNSPCCYAATGASGILPIEFSKKYATAAPTEKGASQNMTFKVEGLKGGHSGYNIADNRTSGSAFMIRYLNELKDNKIHFRIASIDCGEAYNAIPKNFELTLNINKKHEEEATKIFNELADNIKKENPKDVDFTTDIKISEASGVFPSQQDSEKIQDVLNALPNGLIKMSEKYKEIPETSCNIGIVQLKDGQLYCRASFRSSNSQTLEETRVNITKDLKALKIDWEIKPEEVDPA